ncbi:MULTISPECIES: branched-chain amino acid ABC transporter permease [Variovorax]|jgi:branched-chain amino acid transport system permease protein|uniref:branched-chain amino acid ABC transporter permease n=1 Tax=Variovorax TaxID=34072 RepID=UPI00104E2D85|nr:branched-chain amino acid ABC transporter permease [Variovorax paradoxus]MDR6520193.1 branched-chain amino acid transport system permease protein [Variovorax paradoxus]
MEAYLLAVLITALAYVLLTLGLNFQYGFTGLINFGYVGFFALGAYASAICTVRMGWPAWSGFALGMVVPFLLAWPLGRVALRLRDDYLAIVTLGFSEIVRLAIINEKALTNGGQGIAGVPKLFGGDGAGLLGDLWLAAALLAACVLVAGVIRAIVKSPYGRLIQAIRDDETALLALGKNPARFKTQVLMLGGGIAGLAGSFYAHYVGYVTPDQFLPIVTFQVWMAMIMGGVGRLRGAVAGAFLLLLVLEGSRAARDLFPGIPEVAMSSVRLAVIGAALILFIRFRPQGLWGAPRD